MIVARAKSVGGTTADRIYQEDAAQQDGKATAKGVVMDASIDKQSGSASYRNLDEGLLLSNRDVNV